MDGELDVYLNDNIRKWEKGGKMGRKPFMHYFNLKCHAGWLSGCATSQERGFLCEVSPFIWTGSSRAQSLPMSFSIVPYRLAISKYLAMEENLN
jgi:hypothetical protein